MKKNGCVLDERASVCAGGAAAWLFIRASNRTEELGPGDVWIKWISRKDEKQMRRSNAERLRRSPHALSLSPSPSAIPQTVDRNVRLALPFHRLLLSQSVLKVSKYFVSDAKLTSSPLGRPFLSPSTLQS